MKTNEGRKYCGDLKVGSRPSSAGLAGNERVNSLCL